MREDTKEVGVVAEEEVREEGGGRARPMRDRHWKEVEERGQSRNSAAPPYADLTEGGTEEVGVAAEEEEVREEGEGHARRMRCQSQRCHWSKVRRRSIFVIFAPPDGQRGGEGRWGW